MCGGGFGGRLGGSGSGGSFGSSRRRFSLDNRKGHVVDDHVVQRLVTAVGGYVCNGVYHLQAEYNLPKGGVLTVEMGRILMHDKELGGCRIVRVAARHGNDTAGVLDGIGDAVGGELTLDGDGGSAGAVALGVTPLDHKVLDDTVEDQTVIKALADKGLEILNGNGSGGGIQLYHNVTGLLVPAYIFATVNDNCVAVKNSLLMACAYEKAGVPFNLHILEKGYHGLSVNDLTCDTAEALAQRAETTPKNYNDWIGQVFTWLKERGFTITTD